MKLTVQIGWICLAAVNLAILVFGVVVAVGPMGGDAALYRANGLASAGLGLFGALIVLVPYRRVERWAWCALHAAPPPRPAPVSSRLTDMEASGALARRSPLT